ncbi:MAG: MFS transporter [Candidatus Eremiobacteraeota bacterium]|nr:MFS transporter [Candidatus Eremiobacteraeota bacterium]
MRLPGAFKFRDFTLLWFGLLISNLGTWMQITAVGYLVVKLAGSDQLGSFYVGVIGLARAVPVLLLSPVAGVLADKLPRRRVLFVTNSVLSVAALTLAILTFSGAATIWAIAVISIVNSAAQAFDTPARQSWVPLMVDREYVGNAIGLNSVAFNAPAVVGPAISGLLIAYAGISISFFVNAAATLAVVAALLFMTPAPPSSTTRESFVGSLIGGLRFLWEHPILQSIMVFFALTALFVRPYGILLPSYALNYLHTNSLGYGWAYAAQGLGAFGGALLTATLGSREGRGRMWLWTGGLMCVGVAALGFTRQLAVAMPILTVIGVAQLAFMGASNILIQMLSSDELRGRAVAVYSMTALGIVPAGAFLVGGLGSVFGLDRVFALFGVLCALVLAVIWLRRPIVRTV